MGVLAEGCPENQDRFMALGVAETAMQVRTYVRGSRKGYIGWHGWTGRYLNFVELM